MMFDYIEEVDTPRYTVKDYRDAIESVKEMQGGFRAAYHVCRSRSERELVERLIQLADSFEVILKQFPPPGIYQRVE